MKVRHFLVILPLAALGAAASNGPAGGIDDQPCPNVAGENTNTCPAGTVGKPYAIRFVEREGSGCGPGRQTFHVDSGIAPPGLTLAADGELSGTPRHAGRFRFYVEMLEPKDDPATCAGKETQKEFTLPIRTPVYVADAPPAPFVADAGAELRASFRARGGTGVFEWSLVRGKLPPGVRLLRGGTIRGRPRAAGTFRFMLGARDTEKRAVSWRVTMLVR
jgi:hypothetical protein